MHTRCHWPVVMKPVEIFAVWCFSFRRNRPRLAATMHAEFLTTRHTSDNSDRGDRTIQGNLIVLVSVDVFDGCANGAVMPLISSSATPFNRSISRHILTRQSGGSHSPEMHLRTFFFCKAFCSFSEVKIAKQPQAFESLKVNRLSVDTTTRQTVNHLNPLEQERGMRVSSGTKIFHHVLLREIP